MKRAIKFKVELENSSLGSKVSLEIETDEFDTKGAFL
jgi:hypothetical protein